MFRNKFAYFFALLLCLLICAVSVMPQALTAEASNIVKGDTTANIKAVQQRLSDLGYYTYKVDRKSVV